MDSYERRVLESVPDIRPAKEGEPPNGEWVI